MTAGFDSLRKYNVVCRTALATTGLLIIHRPALYERMQRDDFNNAKAISSKLQELNDKVILNILKSPKNLEKVTRKS